MQIGNIIDVTKHNLGEMVESSAQWEKVPGLLVKLHQDMYGNYYLKEVEGYRGLQVEAGDVIKYPGIGKEPKPQEQIEKNKKEFPFPDAKKPPQRKRPTATSQQVDNQSKQSRVIDKTVTPDMLKRQQQVKEMNARLKEKKSEVIDKASESMPNSTGLQQGITPNQAKKKTPAVSRIPPITKPKQTPAKPKEVKVAEIMPAEKTRELTELERCDRVEAADIAGNSDMVLQYSAAFRNNKTGKTDTRTWFGKNAYHLGVMARYIDNGWSMNQKYSDTNKLKICDLTLTKGEQVVTARGVYTKDRLKSFLSEAKEECLDTFAYRNALKKIVTVRDIAEAVIQTQAIFEKLKKLPTKEVLYVSKKKAPS